MAFQFCSSAIVARDGSAAVELVSFEGVAKVPDRQLVAFYFLMRLKPAVEPIPLEVHFYKSLAFSPKDFGIPDYNDREANFAFFAEAAVGEQLVANGVDGLKSAGGKPVVIECFPKQFQIWQERPAADEAEIELYVAAKLYWSRKFGDERIMLTSPDFLRLRSTHDQVRLAAKFQEGNYWHISQMTPNALFLEATPGFLQEIRSGFQGSSFKAPLGNKPLGQASASSAPFVDESRIAGLRAVKDTRFDLQKLLTMCEELNATFEANCYFSVAMLTRAILDHVPPIFTAANFAEVANNYAGGSSFRKSMQNLEKSLRNISDAHLHVQIRSKEVLPTRTQVNFANDLDVLLGEIVRVLS